MELYKDSLSAFRFNPAKINLLYLVLLLFVICKVILITLSLFTEKPDEGQFKDAIYHKAIDGAYKTKPPIGLTISLFGVNAHLWIYFS